LTGLREGELCNLKWSDYVESEKFIVIRVMEGNKTKREGKVPLSPDAVSILTEQRDNRQSPDSYIYIFTNDHGFKLDNANIYRHLKVIAKNEKILDAKVHTFRHTCASHLVIKGVSLYIV
jgi:integrase